jgi:transketolase
MGAAVHAAVAHDGPVYIRGLRGEVVELFDPRGFELKIGIARRLSDGTDVGVVAAGVGTQWALEAAAVLGDRGLGVSILHVPTLKPADRDAIVDFCTEFAEITTIENHSVIGGLGSVVAESLAGAGVGARLRCLGVPDRWAPAGSLDSIRRQLGLDATSIAEALMPR